MEAACCLHTRDSQHLSPTIGQQGSMAKLAKAAASTPTPSPSAPPRQCNSFYATNGNTNKKLQLDEKGVRRTGKNAWYIGL